MTRFSISFYYAPVAKGSFMQKFILCALVTSFCFIQLAEAQELVRPKVDEQQEVEYAYKAKNRIYAGGKDEEDLKIQPQISNPPRKLAPQAEVIGNADE